ncbi:hypothetical protein BMF94_4344 [Rhodotorula taiwanensis]|uniref:Distal membrane-arm assembly complex protein 1-like domain-containing protein n=1 Tax=Rhodotorula taiwanensis TaxID=741276 RepID=A0A2S5B6X7_9BASI|nr:hypothetical protein BMF94_4344 [Rhodotorula taiwanensis]
MPSNLVPSSWQKEADEPSTAETHHSATLPAALYTDCQSCRITGTLTFSAVGLYALTAARGQANTRTGKGVASLAGLGFLAVAAARWTAYTPPPASPHAEPNVA